MLGGRRPGVFPGAPPVQDPKLRDQLVALAEQCREQAHAPWSGLLVGAAVLTRDGRMHGGCNVESAAFPLGGCAERHAIAAAVLAGGPGIEVVAVAIAARDNRGRLLAVPPCGGCRQLIREFGSQAEVGWRDAAGTCNWHAIGHLLPEAFEMPPE